jgi:CSLREA domain-containing protein
MEAGTGKLNRSNGLVVLKIAASVLLFTALLLSTGPLPAGAIERTFNVNSLGDDGDADPGDGICETTMPGECTLRAALEEADYLYYGYHEPYIPDTDLQTIIVPTGTYYVYSELYAGGNVRILGAGRDATILYAQGGRVLSVTSGNTAVIESLTLTNGLAESAGGIYTTGDLTLVDVAVTNNTATTYSGGGIRNAGSLTLDHVLVSGNQAEQNAGGIDNFNAGTTLSIIDSTFYRNKSVDTTGSYAAGAIFNNAGAELNVQRSIFEGNSAPAGGAIFNNGSAKFTNVTFYNNKGTTTSGAGGAAIYNNGLGGQLWLWNVTIAANESTLPAALTNSGTIEVMAHSILVENPGGDCNNTGTVIAANEHHNMSSDPSGCTILTDPSDQANTDAKVLAPADNGGSTLTMALASDSPAIDAGDDSLGCRSGGAPLIEDQRGFPRPIDGNVDGVAVCDLGAYEAPPPYQLFLPLIMR